MNEEKIAENNKKGIYLPYLVLPVALVAAIAYWLIAGRYITLTTNLVPHWVGFVVLAITAVFLALLLFSSRTINPSGISALRKKSVMLGVLFLFPTFAGLFYSSTMIIDAFKTKIPNIFTLIIGMLYLFYAMFMVLTSVQFFIAKTVSPTKSPFLPFIAILPFCIESIMLALKKPTSLHRITSTLHMVGFILAIIWFAILIHSFYVAMPFKRMQGLYIMGFMLFLFSTCFGAVRIITELFRADSLTLSTLAELFVLPALGVSAAGVSVWIAFCGKQQVAIAVSEDNFLFDLDTMLLPKLNSESAPAPPTPVIAQPTNADMPAESDFREESIAPDDEQEEPFAIALNEDDSPDAQEPYQSAQPPYPDGNFFSGFAQDNDTSPFGESFFDSETASDTSDDDFLKQTSPLPDANNNMAEIKVEKTPFNTLFEDNFEEDDPQTAQEDDLLFSTEDAIAENPASQAAMLDLFAAEETAPPPDTATQPNFFDVYTTDNLDDAFLGQPMPQDLFAANVHSDEENSNAHEAAVPADIFADTIDKPTHTLAFDDTDFFDAESGLLDDAFLNQKNLHDLHMDSDGSAHQVSLFGQVEPVPAVAAQQIVPDNYRPPAQQDLFVDGNTNTEHTLFEDSDDDFLPQAEHNFAESYPETTQPNFYGGQGAVEQADLFAADSEPLGDAFFNPGEQQGLYTDNNSPVPPMNLFEQAAPVPPAQEQYIVLDNYTPSTQQDMFAEESAQNNLFENSDEDFLPQAEHNFAESYPETTQPNFYGGQGAVEQAELFAADSDPLGDAFFNPGEQQGLYTDNNSPVPPMNLFEQAAPVPPAQEQYIVLDNYTPSTQQDMFAEESAQNNLFENSDEDFLPQAEHNFAESYPETTQPNFYSGQNATQQDLFAEDIPPAQAYAPQNVQQDEYQQPEQNFAGNYAPSPQPDFYSEQNAIPPQDLFAEDTPPAQVYAPQNFQQDEYQQPEQNFFNEDAFTGAKQYAAHPLPTQQTRPQMPEYIYEPLMPAPKHALTPGLRTPVIQSSPTVNLRVEEILAELEMENNAKHYIPAATPAPQKDKPAGKRIFKRGI